MYEQGQFGTGGTSGNANSGSPFNPPIAVLSNLIPTPNPKQFGAIGNGVADDTIPVQACINYAAANNLTAYIVGGPYLCSADILLPVGVNETGAMMVQGAGWNMPGLIFTGGAHGLYSNGSNVSFPYGNTIKDLWIACNGGAVGVYDFGLDKPVRQNLNITGATNQGHYSLSCNAPEHQNIKVQNCGSSTTNGQVEFDRCTDIDWSGYIATGAAGCQSGLKIDRCTRGNFRGAVESCGVLLLIASLAEATLGCAGLNFNGIGLENPTTAYVQAGQGLSGTALVSGLKLDGCTMFPSGAVSIPKAVQLWNTAGAEITSACTISQPVGSTATISLEQTANSGCKVGASRQNYNTGFPWVLINGTQVTGASPLIDWSQDNPKAVDGQNKTLPSNTTNPTLLIVTQGGIPKNPKTFNSAGTLYTIMIGANGNPGLVMYLSAFDANSTLTHDATQAVTDGFFLLGQVNLALTNKNTYGFMSNGTQWRQFA